MSGAADADAIPVRSADGHAAQLRFRQPEHAWAALLWLPALGIPARHYLPFAEALAARGVAVFLHEWRGAGSSSLRAGSTRDWGYRELLERDIPASQAAMAAQLPAGMRRIIGGHSLGGQLACCRQALAPEDADALWLVASGAPWWRAFPMPYKAGLPLVYRFLPWLARINGALPGRRLGFGGREAAGVIADWARTGLAGRYSPPGLREDPEALLRRVTAPVSAIALAGDWLGPPASLDFLLGKLSPAERRVTVMDSATLGAPADHYAWMKQPDAVADWLCARRPQA